MRRGYDHRFGDGADVQQNGHVSRFVGFNLDTSDGTAKAWHRHAQLVLPGFEFGKIEMTYSVGLGGGRYRSRSR